MEKILIFGATGTIGAYTSLYLKEKGYKVFAVGKRNSDNGFFEEHGIRYFSVDITKKEQFRKLLSLKGSSILHFAGSMPGNMDGYFPQQYIDSIITGTLNVLNFAIKNNSKKIIFTQSRADSNHLMGTKIPVPSDINKTFPLNTDHSIYAICKNAAVDLIEHYFYKYGLKRFVLRLPTVYAFHPNPFFYVNGEKKWIAYRLLIEKALRGETVEIWGDPTKQKEITYIMDFCQLAEKAILTDVKGGIYNFGRGVGVSLEEQIKGIVDVFHTKNGKSPIVLKPEMPNARQFIHDISKTQNELGYDPEYDYLKLLNAFKREMATERFERLWGKRNDYLID